MPAISISPSPSDVLTRDSFSLDHTTLGIMLAGILRSFRRSLSQRSSTTLYNSVRDALVRSVTWRLPLVRFQINQLSTVPKASLPRSARERAPSTLSRIHAILVPEK